MEEDILSSLPKKLVPGLKYSKKFDIDIPKDTALTFYRTADQYTKYKKPNITIDFLEFKSPYTTIEFYLQNNNDVPFLRVEKGQKISYDSRAIYGPLKAGKLTVNFDVNIDESETVVTPFLIKMYKILPPPKQNNYNMVIIGLVLLLALYMCYATFRKNRFAFGKRRR